MSPDGLFRGRARGRMGGYRMRLSQRHHILQHYMNKCGGRRGQRTFHRGGEGGEVISEGEESGKGVSEEEEGEESEAEEVMVCYGEEDREELPGSQSIGEPWDWEEGEEMGGVQGDGVRTKDAGCHHSDHHHSDQGCQQPTLEAEEVVSPSLLVSVSYIGCGVMGRIPLFSSVLRSWLK